VRYFGYDVLMAASIAYRAAKSDPTTTCCVPKRPGVVRSSELVLGFGARLNQL
jgi:hypothetical protein